MKSLLTTTAVLEVGAGLALVALPSVVAGILVGSTLDTPAALTVARVTGAALLALGLACWFARDDSQSPSARGLVVAMLLYNIAVAAILAFAGIGLELRAMGLWPAVALHIAMGVWCIVRYRRNSN